MEGVVRGAQVRCVVRSSGERAAGKALTTFVKEFVSPQSDAVGVLRSVLQAGEKGSTGVENSRASSQTWSPKQGCYDAKWQVPPGRDAVRGNDVR